jgi:acyl-CoA reductase-like NAD-dependent aldehyde dehydrogenase
MERTSELFELVGILTGSPRKSDFSDGSFTTFNRPNNAMGNLVKRIDTEINTNNTLLARMEKLTNRREFSNDPTSEISFMAETFQKAISNIQKDLELIKSKTQQHVRMYRLDINV